MPSRIDRAEELGPVQVLIVAFDDPSKLRGRVLDELLRLRRREVVRLLDLVVVVRDGDGEVRIVQDSDLDTAGAAAFGSVLKALLGVGQEDDTSRLSIAALAGAAGAKDGHVFDQADVWYLADTVPPGSAAAVALIEHRWAIPLDVRIAEAGGEVVGREWIHPADLLAAREQVAQTTP